MNVEVKEQLIAGAGSNRRYFRVTVPDGSTYIRTEGENVKENEAFVYLAGFLGAKGLPVPKVMEVKKKYYTQTDVGDVSLFELITHEKDTQRLKALLAPALELLARLHATDCSDLDWERCFPSPAMDLRMIRWDLNYFKYCFLKPSGIEMDEVKLQDEFDHLEEILAKSAECAKGFMHRDFQSRNIMVDAQGKQSMIDFQGGRRGPGEYDVASFLWQAKAHLPKDIKDWGVKQYLTYRQSFDPVFDADGFESALPYFILFRVLQTLGAYGFRGWVERKSHFLSSIESGVHNLLSVVEDNFKGEFPYLFYIADRLSKQYRATPVERIAAKENKLTVKVTSFSYKKRIPDDPSGNGGGFVFDCRAPHNPGRYEEYKSLTGLDKPVIDFLEADGEILPFFDGCRMVVDAAVERYLQRGFTSLMVSFGCTGGQHRSVYCAQKMALHLNNKYGVTVDLCHREQDISRILPARDVEVVFDSYLKKKR